MEVRQKKFHIEEEHENDELWAISYGDMITLLLCFFVLFFSVDVQKKEKENKAQADEKLDSHLMSSFKMLTLDKSKTLTQTSETSAQDKMIHANPKFDLLKKAKITKAHDRLLVTFDTMSFFNSGDTEINNNGKAALKEFAKKFTPYAGVYKINIKAFTDHRPVKRKHRYKDNMELSVLRALSAMRALQNAGIPLNRMELGGYGEMDKLHTVMEEKDLKNLSGKKIQDFSRTLIIIIKHDNEQSLL